MYDNILQWLTTPPTGVDMMFWGCALIGTLIFAIQTVLTLIGMEGHAVLDVDFTDGDAPDVEGSIPFFSIHSLVNFVLGFGWAGVAFANDIPSKPLLYIVAIVVGLLFAYVYIFLRKKMLKLEHNGAYKIQDAVGKVADVYLRIPANGQGRGKVQVSINGSIHEIDAVSNGDPIPTGAKVMILSVDGAVLTVEKQ